MASKKKADRGADSTVTLRADQGGAPASTPEAARDVPGLGAPLQALAGALRQMRKRCNGLVDFWVEGPKPIELERIAAELGAIGFLASKEATAADALVPQLRSKGGDDCVKAADAAGVLWTVADATAFALTLLGESGQNGDTRVGVRNMVELLAFALEGAETQLAPEDVPGEFPGQREVRAVVSRGQGRKLDSVRHAIGRAQKPYIGHTEGVGDIEALEAMLLDVDPKRCAERWVRHLGYKTTRPTTRREATA